jgi:Predicted Zn peptidase
VDDEIKKLVRRFKTTDPFKIAEGLNILIRYADFEGEIRGFYYRLLRRRFIVLDSGLDWYWRRIVCAHELGHDRLHPGVSRFWVDEQSFRNMGKYERQANLFALKLLTYGEEIFENETLNSYLTRCGIPHELHSLYL